MIPAWDESRRDKGNANLRLKVRQWLRNRDGDKCFYCSMKMNFIDSFHERYATIEHMIPLCSGLANWSASNLVLCCHCCNQSGGGASYRKKLESVGRKRKRKEKRKEKSVKRWMNKHGRGCCK